MKRLFVMLMVVFAFVANADAQGWLKKLGEKAVDAGKRAVERKVENKVERETEDAMDGVLDGKKKDKSDKSDKKSKSETADVEVDSDNEEPAAQAEHAKSDFVRGSLVFFNDPVDEQVGEFPSMWEFLNGQEIEVVTLKGVKCIKLSDGAEIMPLMKEKVYLPEEFTIEFDIYVQKPCEESSHDRTLRVMLKDEHGHDCAGWDVVPETHNHFGYGGDWSYWAKTPQDRDVHGKLEDKDAVKLLKNNTWNHIAFSFNKRALKGYVNGTRGLNLPSVKQPSYLQLYAGNVNNSIIYIRNIVMAKGAVQLYERKTTDYADAVEKAIAETGKFVTNNILFETGKATLKAESMTEIEKVAEYMKKNPRVRFEVQGHTDNQGSDNINDPLSQQRAEAVVAALAKLGVDDFNLKAVGKGSHEPVADNKTEAGRAKNRRVEFIKR